MKAADVMKLMEEKGHQVCGLPVHGHRGKEQHVTVPSSQISEDVFD